MMQAIVQDAYGSADVLRLRDVERPRVGERDVLVEVHAAGLDPGVWHLMTGRPYLVRLMGFGLWRPKDRVAGQDVAGRVAAVGAGVARLRPGDEVFGTCSGAFAEYARGSEDTLASKPANLTFEQAAVVPTSAATALQALRDTAYVEAGQRVLVIGAGGGVGTFAVQIARALGAEVTGVCSAGKTDMVHAIGARHVIDYEREDFAAGRRRFDIILDTAGNRSLSHLRRALEPEGTLVIVGGEGGGPLLGGTDRQLRAALLSPFVRQTLGSLFSTVVAADLERLRELLEAGQVVPVIGRACPLREVPDAVRQLEAGHARGKIAIAVRSEA